MLDISKLLLQLDQAKKSLFIDNKDDQNWLYGHWNKLIADVHAKTKIMAKKWGVLVPVWEGNISHKVSIEPFQDNYSFLAVDGSQVYYDRHQGPPCYLINIGSCFISYIRPVSEVACSSTPLFSLISANQEKSQGFIDLKREEEELYAAVKLSQELKSSNIPFLCAFDGSLLFWALEGMQEDEQGFLGRYFESLQKLYEQQIPYIGYISYPRNKDLVNVLKLYAVDFQESQLDTLSHTIQSLVDVDIVAWYLPEGCRSQIFESKAPISYIYPQALKPYFCYFNVGFEIVRIEFPAWIIQDIKLVDTICAMIYDQTIKGRGYPVCLFEAHEQAVIKQQDRQLFYHALQMVGAKNFHNYSFSQKSLKKRQVDL